MKGIIAVKRIENNQLIVKYIHRESSGEYVNVASAYTAFNAELIKMFRECYENEIYLQLNEFAEVDEKYSNDEYLIEDIRLTMGTDKDLFVLEVII